MTRIRLLYWVNNISYESFIEVFLDNKDEALKEAKKMYPNCECCIYN